eukprot:scaffold1388_cov390-Prasinococcus_capsulatus_cf.AAC.28
MWTPGVLGQAGSREDSPGRGRVIALGPTLGLNWPSTRIAPLAFTARQLQVVVGSSQHAAPAGLSSPQQGGVALTCQVADAHTAWSMGAVARPAA